MLPHVFELQAGKLFEQPTAKVALGWVGLVASGGEHGGESVERQGRGRESFPSPSGDQRYRFNTPRSTVLWQETLAGSVMWGDAPTGGSC